ncbi:MAG: hypothetical protein ACOCQD_04455 [archaeon]
MIEYKDTVYDSEKLQFWCYDEKITSELWIYNGSFLMRYCRNDLEKLAMIYREEYGEVYYEGTLEELPANIQLYIRLTD